MGSPQTGNAAPLDVLIVGAGMSGVGLGCTLARELPHKRWLILEARDALGGTWDLFRYPGVRSDSDLHTFAFDFKPWTGDKALAGGDEILAYMREAVAEYAIADRIRYRHKVIAADWDSATGLWTVTIRRGDGAGKLRMQCRWLFGATGYYDYDRGYRPHFEGEESFRGALIHPQAWPADFDYAGKRIAIIGSGATAVTLAPALAQKAAHVTQIQRTPSYVMPVPSEDGIANRLRRWLPPKLAYALARRKNILRQQGFYRLFRRYPNAARRFIRWANRRALPDGFPVDTHFNPPYAPWDQRLCAVADGDFFRELGKGRVSIVTGTIDRFTPKGVRMASGEEIEADAIVTATGLTLKLFGGAKIAVDGRPVIPADKLIFKGAMLDGVPNFCFAIGYTVSSWTLKIGLLCAYFCRLLKELDARGMSVCVAERPHGAQGARPALDFSAGYVQRSIQDLPKQGVAYPWVMSFDYMADAKLLKRGPVIEPEMRLSNPAAARERAPA